MRHLLRVLLACTAALLILPGTALAAPAVAGHLRYAIDTAAASADYSRTPARQSYLILQGFQAQRMRELKAANPKLRVLLYKDLSAVRTADPSGYGSTGVTLLETAAHPDWLLLNTAGQRFTFREYDWLWAADVGNRDYQRRWADNVLAQVRRDGWDGVFMDDTNPSMSFHYDVGRIAAYPTDLAWQGATRSALRTIGGRFRRAHRLVIPNFGFWKDNPALIAEWLRYVDGGFDEWFVKYGAHDVASARRWETQLQEVKTAQAMGKAFLGVAHSSPDDRAGARYGWATLLLAARGRAAFALHGDYTGESWFPEYDYDIGRPLGAERAGAGGVHRRAFSHGLVVVNPTDEPRTVDLGARYSGSGLSAATRARLAPRSALVLTRDGRQRRRASARS